MPAAVITPMARDWLKQRGIMVRRGTADLSLQALGEWAFAMAGDAEILGTVQALRRSLLDDARAWIEIESSLVSVGSWLLTGKGRGVMYVTSETALAVWRACRLAGIRAASATEPADVSRAAGSFGMNLLVLDPAGKSISWLRQLASTFRACGPPRIPDHLAMEPEP